MGAVRQSTASTGGAKSPNSKATSPAKLGTGDGLGAGEVLTRGDNCGVGGNGWSDVGRGGVGEGGITRGVERFFRSVARCCTARGVGGCVWENASRAEIGTGRYDKSALSAAWPCVSAGAFAAHACVWQGLLEIEC